MTDEELMQQYQLGDEKAFEALYSRYSGKVYGYLRNALRTEEAASDVLQATFLKFHRTRHRYDPDWPVAPWLFTICRTVMLDYLRKQKRIVEDPASDVIDAKPAPEQVAPAARAGFAELAAVLPAKQREAIEMRYGQELSFEEIAQRLETSPANIRQIVSRAVRRLRKNVGIKGDVR